MTIRLDHTIVPVKDKLASANFFADLFGLEMKGVSGPFAQVQVDDNLTLDFADDPAHGGGAVRHGLHYAFHISDGEFDAIIARIKARKIAYGSGPSSASDGRINHRRGGRGFYCVEPSGHMLEVMTVPETGT